MFTLETNTNTPFETTKKVTAIPTTAPDATPLYFLNVHTLNIIKLSSIKIFNNILMQP